MINVNLILGGFTRGHVPRRQREHPVSSDLTHIASLVDNLETELVTIREEIADIEGRLRDVAEKWEFRKPAGPPCVESPR